MGSPCMLEGLEALVNRIQNLTEEEQQRIADDWNACPADTAPEYVRKQEGIVFHIMTQFSGDSWYPYDVHPYITAIYGAMHAMHDRTARIGEGKTVHNKSTVSMMHGWAQVQEAGTKSAKELLHESFPCLGSGTIKEILRILSVWDEKEPGWEGLFSLLSGTSYSHVSDLSDEDLIVVYYPRQRYDESCIKEIIIPGYKQAVVDYNAKYDAWLWEISNPDHCILRS